MASGNTRVTHSNVKTVYVCGVYGGLYGRTEAERVLIFHLAVNVKEEEGVMSFICGGAGGCKV